MVLSDLRAGTAERMVAAGMQAAAASAKGDVFARCGRALREAGRAPDDRVRCLWVPGRIEVLGKHTDYAGGRSLLAATERGFCFVLAARDDARLRIVDAARGQAAAFEISPELVPRAGDWTNYPMTVARRLARNFGSGLRGADVAFGSDLPVAAGMSSSSAMIVGFSMLLMGANRLFEAGEYGRNIRSAEDLAGYLGTVENGQSFGTLAGDRGVGTFGGSEDHTAILCCKPDRLSQYSYCPVRFERMVDLPEGYTFVVGVSGVAAEKTGAAMEKYNRASRLGVVAAEVWRRETGFDDPHLAAAVLRAGGDSGRIREVLMRGSGAEFAPEELAERFTHFYTESEEILPAAGDALFRGDAAGFGEAVDRSQELGAQMLKNQIPETIFLARAARELGACAASAFGAGFGGSVWALVERTRAGELTHAWRARYAEEFPVAARGAEFFETGAGPAAFDLDERSDAG